MDKLTIAVEDSQYNAELDALGDEGRRRLLMNLQTQLGYAMRDNNILRKQLELLGFVEWKSPVYPNKQSGITGTMGKSLEGAKTLCAKCDNQISYLDEHDTGCPSKT